MFEEIKMAEFRTWLSVRKREHVLWHLHQAKETKLCKQVLQSSPKMQSCIWISQVAADVEAQYKEKEVNDTEPSLCAFTYIYH